MLPAQAGSKELCQIHTCMYSIIVRFLSRGQFLCVGGRGLLEQQFRRFLSVKNPQFTLGGGRAGVGGARKRKQLAPRKAPPPPRKRARQDREGERWGE